MRHQPALVVSFAVGLVAPLASYALRAFGDGLGAGYIGGTEQVTVALVVVAPGLAYLVYRSGLRPSAAATAAALGFVVGAVLAYAWWFALYADTSWPLSVAVLAAEAIWLAFVTACLSTLTYAAISWKDGGGRSRAV